MEKLGNARFARYAWGVLAYNVLVILWGAVVRVTGSGAGCGNHWPTCNGEVLPQAPAMHTMIEFTHRMMTGLDGPMIILLIVWAFRGFPKLHPVRRAAIWTGVFLVTESLIGAALVKFDYVAQSAAVGRGPWLAIHLMNTLTLVACLALTAWWGGGRPRVRFAGRPAWIAGATLGSVMLLGVSGAIAALGDTLFPAHSLVTGFAQDISAGAHIFLRLRAIHPMLAALVAAWLLFYAITTPRGQGTPYARWLLVMVVAQLTAGVLNLVLLAPAWLQIVHLLLADLLWIALVLLCAARLGLQGKGEEVAHS